MRIVIDLGAWAHGIRRWWWQNVAGGFYTQTAIDNRCVDCGKVLTQDERTYYACTCERCEGLWMRKLGDA
jgi:endogenous inhibitor of DNA gyrase (YacG/DUF329 family)